VSWLELMCDFCRPIFGDSPGRWVFPRTDANGDPLHTGKGLEGPSVRQQVVRQKLECDPPDALFPRTCQWFLFSLFYLLLLC